MRFGAFEFVTLLLLSFIPGIHAIFADEAYQLDYHHALLGTPQAPKTFFHRPSKTSKAALLYTLSERNVLGAVNPKDGTLLWRHPLSENHSSYSVHGLLVVADEGEVLFTGSDKLLQAWNAVDGRLVWEQKADGQIKALEVVSTPQSEGDLLAVFEAEGSSSEVRRLVGDIGDIKWRQQIRLALLLCTGSITKD